jgi:predicted dehydrogenase
MDQNPAYPSRRLSRRRFLRGSAAVASVPLWTNAVTLAAEGEASGAKRKIKLGLVGCGARGSWIAKLFQEHGGYEVVSVADYFQEVADACGDAVGVDKARRFSGLSGYRKVIDSGIEAIALETPPYVFPEHTTAAVEAGLHVFMAKPVGVDVPGALAVEAAGKLAGEKGRCFLVDYQIPTDALNIEVCKRVHEGAVGEVAYLQTLGLCGGFRDPPKTATIESRLRHLIWVNDVALGGDYLGNHDIHALDAALWVAGERPQSAMGASRIVRPEPHGDASDVCSVIYEFSGGLVWNHAAEALRNKNRGTLSCEILGTAGNAMVTYWGEAYVRGGPKPYDGGKVEDLFKAGAQRNIAGFYRDVLAGRCENPTIRRAVDGVLTGVLGREAAARRQRLTMEEVMRENKRLEVDLSGLKA